MPRIQEYTAKGDFSPSNTGIAAYDTMGRRVAGQYDAAASDLTQAARITAQSNASIGRWPFNIIKLQNAIAQQRAGASGGGGGGVKLSHGRGSITDSQFAPRYMPDLAALNETSEGMGALGRYTKTISTPGYGGGGGYGGSGTSSSTTSDRDGYDAMTLRARDREAQLEDAAYQKSWNNYENNLYKYNQTVLKDAQTATPYGVYPTSNDPASDNAYLNDGSDYGSAPVTQTDYGGGNATLLDPSSWF